MQFRATIKHIYNLNSNNTNPLLIKKYKKTTTSNNDPVSETMKNNGICPLIHANVSVGSNALNVCVSEKVKLLVSLPLKTNYQALRRNLWGALDKLHCRTARIGEKEFLEQYEQIRARNNNQCDYDNVTRVARAKLVWCTICMNGACAKGWFYQSD